jgi:hypothetical protein
MAFDPSDDMLMFSSIFNTPLLLRPAVYAVASACDSEVMYIYIYIYICIYIYIYVCECIM